MSTYPHRQDYEGDELMPPSLSHRAPRTISYDEDQSPTSHTSNTHTTYEEEPMDERMARRDKERSIQSLSCEDAVDPSSDWGSQIKSKKIRHRPWKTAKMYNGIETQEDDDQEEENLRVVSPVNDMEGLSEDDEEDLDDLSSRWNQTSSKEDIRRATIQAVALASEAAANQTDEDDDFEERSTTSSISARSKTLAQGRQVLSESSYNHRSTSSYSNNNTLTSSVQDPERVRMEALKMLELAEVGSTTNGQAGYALQTTKSKRFGGGGGKYSRTISAPTCDVT